MVLCNTLKEYIPVDCGRREALRVSLRWRCGRLIYRSLAHVCSASRRPGSQVSGCYLSEMFGGSSSSRGQ